MYDSEYNAPQTESSRSYVVTLVLCLFFGVFGVHRFYTGHVLIGVLQLLTGGGLFIWSFIDLVMLAMNKFTDSEGLELREFNPGCALIVLIFAAVIAFLILIDLIFI